MKSAKQVAEQLVNPDALDGGGTDTFTVVVGRAVPETDLFPSNGRAMLVRSGRVPKRGADSVPANRLELILRVPDPDGFGMGSFGEIRFKGREAFLSSTNSSSSEQPSSSGITSISRANIR